MNTLLMDGRISIKQHFQGGRRNLHRHGRADDKKAASSSSPSHANYSMMHKFNKLKTFAWIIRAPLPEEKLERKKKKKSFRKPFNYNDH